MGGHLEKVTIVYGGISAGHAPLWVTHEVGFRRKHGLGAQVVLVGNGSGAVQLLISRDVAFAQMARATPLQNSLKSADRVMIAGLLNTMPFQFAVPGAPGLPQQYTVNAGDTLSPADQNELEKELAQETG